ncbi:CHAT domain-containing protein [Candidatus Nitronereus thalassa]|uniref:CHAT domain-containing protein n=1 Tax=Candidatus Nitronereus thalassa TaxID=3020898 RepID=A0ABU3K7B5_9BACT|nr:CHAT domain-containing protein [Candidatus Nitronereus thalassa]MDT7042285.1 CHAT domain-containing protein [Candidatus Nitronereus thalassa]
MSSTCLDTSWRLFQYFASCLFVSSLVLASGLPGYAAEVRQVTTHPALDYFPAPSRDGRFLAFVSERSGNADIWLKSLKLGVVSLPRQLTTHPSIDRDPALNAEGSRLLYVSHKSDPRGDVYLMNLTTGEERRLTDLRTADSLPAWGSDGASVYYLSQNVTTGVQSLKKRSLVDDQESILVADVLAYSLNENGWILVSQGGALTFVQEQSLDNGRTVPTTPGLNMWSAISDNGVMAFTHYAQDTNEDGVVDANDESSIWLSQWDFQEDAQSSLFQMTPIGHFHLYPAMAQGDVYFTDLEQGNIFRIKIQEFLNDYSSFEKAKTLADRLMDGGDFQEGLVVLANISHNLTQAFDEKTRAGFDFAYAEKLIEAGEFSRAQQVMTPYADTPGEFGALANIHDIALPLYQNKSSMSEEELKRAVQTGAQDILKIGEAHREQQQVYGQALIEAGRLQLLVDDSLSALDYLVRVDDLTSKEIRAKALFTRGTVYRALGDQKSLVKVFVDVINMFGEDNSWGKRAIAQAITVSEQGEDVHKKVASLRDLITQHETLLMLVGATRLRIADLYEEAGEQLKAIQALDQLLQDPPPSEALVTQAYRQKGEILASAERYEEAAEVYAILVARTEEDQALLARAKRLMVLQLVNKAKKERTLGEVRIAAKAFYKITQDYPDSVEAHRGYIETKVMLKELAEVQTRYQELVAKNPDSPIYQYSKALAHSYAQPLELPKVVEPLEAAIRLDPGVSFYHQTLGWAHEQQEQIEGNQGFLEKAEQEYRIALELNDEFQFPEVESNLLLNLGNTYRTLGNFHEAYRAYHKRESSYKPAGDSITELLYRKNYGEACFKSGRTQEALVQYQLAYHRIPADQNTLKAELLERIALSHQDLGNHAQAVDAFSQALELNLESGNTKNLALLQRNIGVSLYNLSASGEGGRRKALKQALKSYFTSLDTLSEFGGKQKKEGTGLFNVDVTLDAGGSQAAEGFDQKGERKLMFSYIAGTYERLDEPGPARDNYLKKLALLSEADSADGNVGQLTEKAVVLNRVGLLSHQLGENAQAMDFMRQSLGYTTTLGLSFGTGVNLYNLSRLAAEDVMKGQPVNWTMITALVEGLDTHLAEEQADAATFYALTNTAFLIYHLTEPTLLGSSNTDGAIQAMHTFYDVKGKVWSYYAKAEALLGRGEVVPEEQVLPMQVILKLNKMELAREIGEEDSFLSLQKELSVLLERQPALTGWIGLVAQAEYAKDAAEQQALLARAYDAVLGLPSQASYSPQSATAVLASLHTLSRLYVDQLVDAKAYALAFEVAERLGMRTMAIQLQKSLGEDFFYAGVGEYEDELRQVLAEIRKIPSTGEPDETEVLRAELEDLLFGLYEEYPVATSYFWQYPSPEDLLSEVLNPERLYLKVVEGMNRLHAFIHDGQEVQYLPLEAQGSRVTIGEILGARLSSEAPMYLSIPREYARSVQVAFPPAKPITQVSGLYDIVNGYHQRSVFYSKVGIIGELALDAGLTAGDVPLSAEPLTGVPAHDHPIVDRLEVLISTKPPQAYHFTLAEELQVRELLPLTRLAGRPHHTAVVFQPQSSTDASESALVSALVRSGFPHVLLIRKDDAQAKSFVSLYLAYLNDLPPDEAVSFASQEVWGDKTGAHPVELFGYAGMNEEARAEFASAIYDGEVSAAVNLYQEEQYGSALQKMEHALSVIHYADKSSDFADLTKLAVDASYKVGNYQNAVFHQERLLASLDESTQAEGRSEALYRLGILYSRLEQFDASIGYLEQAIQWWTKAEELDRLAEGIAQLGVVRENMGAYSAALTDFGRSFALYEELGEIGDVATQHRRIGRIYYLRLGRYEKAREQFQSALTLYRNLEDLNGEAETVFEIGLTYEKMGLFDEADTHYLAGMKIGKTLESPYLLATGHLYLANTAWFRGNYQEAFQHLSQAGKQAEAAQDAQLTIMVKNTRGLIYWTLNDLDKGLVHLKQAVELAKKSDIKTELASSLNNLGLIYRQQGDYTTSLEYFEKAKAIDESLNSRWGLGYDYRNIGMALLKLDRLQEALSHFTQAADTSAEIKNSINWVKALLELGNVHRQLNQPEKSGEYYQQAYDLSKKYGIKEVLWRAAAGQAGLLREAGKAEEAFRRYDDAVNVVEGMRAALKIDELRNSFQANKQDLYRETISLLVEMGRTDDAFNYLERSRSRSFIDLLGNQKMTLKNAVDQRALDQIGQLALRVEALTKEVGSYDEAPAELQEKLREAKATHEEALLELKQRNPGLSSFVSVDPLKLSGVKEMLESDTALVSYLLGEETTYVWFIKKSETIFFKLAGGESTIEPLVRQYRAFVQNSEPVDTELRALYAGLIKPWEKHLAGVEHLGIIPDGALHFLSFSALKSDQGYLVDRYPIFYSPSASVLEYTFAKRKDKKRTKVLAIGNPDLGNYNYDLPLAELEAQSIKWNYPDMDILTGAKATKEWFVENISKYGIIHLASHGEFDEVNPLFSSLWLSSSDPKNRKLTVNEVFGLEINADLVTLSACQTGLGKLNAGELIGLNRAFIYAGTHALVSALWRVDDLSTSVLMKHFYRNYVTMNKAKSLRQAQLMVKRDFPHPSYWAGFNLVGDYQ